MKTVANGLNGAIQRIALVYIHHDQSTVLAELERVDVIY